VRVDLIVTGKLEAKALGPALQRWVGRAGMAISIGETVQVRSMTNQRVAGGGLWSKGLLGKADEALRAMLALLEAHDAPELVLLVDDLEVANAGNVDMVREVLRAEVARRDLSDAEAVMLRSRASVHFAVPMIEAWFFPDRQALGAAGSQHGHGAWDPTSDAEAFVVDDRSYLAWHVGIRDYARAPAGLVERHPKRYLDYLCRPRRYREIENARWRGASGQAALAGIDWNVVPQGEPQMAHLRGLLDDLALAAAGQVPAGPNNLFRNM
jgi:hypothetical protein